MPAPSKQNKTAGMVLLLISQEPANDQQSSGNTEVPYNLQPMPGTLEKPLWPIISNPQSTSETLPTHMPSEASDDESESINSKDQGSVGSIQIYIL